MEVFGERNDAKVVGVTSAEDFLVVYVYVVVCACFSSCNSCCDLCWTGALFDYHLLWSCLSSQVTDRTSLNTLRIINSFTKSLSDLRVKPKLLNINPRI